MAEKTERVCRGTHRDYLWLTSTEHYIDFLIKAAPQIFDTRYIAITSADSGSLTLTAELILRGWTSEHGIAYSPRLQAPMEIPHQLDGPDNPGYDELFVFQSPTNLGELTRGNIYGEGSPQPGKLVPFVNFGGFTLYDRSGDYRAISDLFWPQLERLDPESYVADGRECLTFISRNMNLFESVYRTLAG